mmetsp:Transcript_29800/g.58355  ORF Transcript_29800/g.58355 Transcript_29800/m.58355 type:complete len:463 (+) Transcript_29800:99-1487(+)
MGTAWSEVKNKEMERWSNHEMPMANNALTDKWINSCPIWDTFTKVSLCYVTRKDFEMNYRHYVVVLEDGDSEFALEFTGDDIWSSRVQFHPRVPLGLTVEEFAPKPGRDFNRSKYQTRMLCVIGSSNYSLVLRNCEHVGNFVLHGKWFSRQVAAAHQSNLFGYFVSSLSKHYKKNLNAIPRGVMLQLTNLLGGEVNEEKVEPPSRRVLFQGGEFQFEYTDQDHTGSRVTPNHWVYLILGPTGAGKSSLINTIYQQRVARAELQPDSVTNDLAFYYGVVNGPTFKNIPTCFIDTVGFCDTQMSASKTMALLKSRISASVDHINRVVVVLKSRVAAGERAALKQVVSWLQLANYRDRCSTVITYCAGLSAVKEKALVDQFLKSSPMKDYAVPFLEGVTFGARQKAVANNMVAVGLPNPDDYEPEEQPAKYRQLDQALSAVMPLLLNVNSHTIIPVPELTVRSCW